MTRDLEEAGWALLPGAIAPEQIARLRHDLEAAFTPVYKHFVGVEFSDIHAGCVGSVSRVRDLTGLSLLLPVVLTPDWEDTALFQRFKTWPLVSSR